MEQGIPAGTKNGMDGKTICKYFIRTCGCRKTDTSGVSLVPPA